MAPRRPAHQRQSPQERHSDPSAPTHNHFLGKVNSTPIHKATKQATPDEKPKSKTPSPKIIPKNPNSKKIVPATSILDAMPAPERDFFRTLMPSTFLHGRPPKDVYEMLDDSFMLRVSDRWDFLKKSSKPSGGNMSEFRKFLRLAEERDGLLPPWWCDARRRECEESAREGENIAPGSEDYDSFECVYDRGIIEAYEDWNMPMKLRLLAERVYGIKVVPISW